MDAQIPDQELERIEDALFAGHKIQAIKLLRESTGQGLYESKTAVEALEAELRAASPEKFAVSAGRTGCLGRAAVIVVMAGLAVFKFIAG
jgi:hypothetical protein